MPRRYGEEPRLTPEQIAKIDAERARRFEQASLDLEEMREKLGYESVADMKVLGLSEKEIRQLTWCRNQKPDTRYFRATRTDGRPVKAVITPQPGDYAADIFSPANYQGHGGNHDFSKSEMEGSLKHALEGEEYPSREKN